MTDKKIIVFSGKQFSGKDTAAKIILERFKTFKRIGIADAIKMRYSEKTGLSLSEIESDKSKYRKDLIELGDWGRAQDPDYWLNSILEYKGNTVVTDVRVRHELDLFRSYGAFAVRVEASEEVRSLRGTLTSQDDNTETQLDDINDWDFVVFNNGTYDELVQNVRLLENAIIKRFGNNI